MNDSISMKEKVLYDSNIATISKNEKGYYVCHFKKTNSPLDLKESMRQFAFFEQETKGQSYKTLVDITNLVLLPDDDATIHFRNVFNPNNKIAIISTEPSVRLFLIQTIRYRKVKHIMVFQNEKDAVEWLLNESALGCTE